MKTEYWKFTNNSFLKRITDNEGDVLFYGDTDIDDVPKEFLESEDYYYVITSEDEFDAKLNEASKKLEKIQRKFERIMKNSFKDIDLKGEEKMKTEDKVCEILDGMKDLLVYKNRKYGDAALNPGNGFYKGDASNSILIRLDDKFSRIKNRPEGTEPNLDDCEDMLGYLTLYLASKNVKKEDIMKYKD